MSELAALIASLFTGLKLPMKWGAIITTILIVLLGIWGYERLTGYFVLSRLDRETLLLEKLQSISNNGIINHPELQKTYTQIAAELETYEASNNSPPQTSINNFTLFGKALSGSLLWIIVFFVGISQQYKLHGKITGGDIALFVVFLLLIGLFAYIGTIIPTVINPWINYIVFPGLQFLIVFLLFRKRSTT